MSGQAGQPPPEVDALPLEADLEGEAAERFAERRKRIAARYGRWRANFAAVEMLMETEVERATAMAGNYCTEAEAVLVAWLETRAEAAGGALPPGEVVACRRRMDELVRQWSRAALAHGPRSSWEREARDQFSVVVGELMPRARQRAEVRLSELVRLPGRRWLRPLRRLGRAVRRALAGFFDPGQE